MDNSLKGFYSEMEKGENSVFWGEVVRRLRAFESAALDALVSDPIEKHGELQGRVRAYRIVLGLPEAIKRSIIARQGEPPTAALEDK